MKPGEVFRPFERFDEILIVPAPLSRYRGIGPGAKLTWGRLARYQSKSGDAFPSIPTLAAELGIGATQARAYVQELVRENLVRITQRSGTSSTYEFLWHAAFDGNTGEKRKAPPLRKTGGVPVRKTGGVTPAVNRSTPLRKTGDEENQRSESSSSRESIEESQEEPRQSSEGATVPPKPSKKPKPLSLRVDDDDKPKPSLKETPGLQYASPRDELIGLMERKYGVRPSARTLSGILTRLESRFPPVSWQQFFEQVRPELERGELTNPEGFIVSASKNLAGASRPEARAIVPPPPEAPKCPICHAPGGKGVLMVDRKIVPCECATPEWAEKIRAMQARDEERAAAREQKTAEEHAA
jgi:hypothetical protein